MSSRIESRPPQDLQQRLDEISRWYKDKNFRESDKLFKKSFKLDPQGFLTVVAEDVRDVFDDPRFVSFSARKICSIWIRGHDELAEVLLRLASSRWSDSSRDIKILKETIGPFV